MGFWQEHKGQTGYRLMNLIEQYCGFRVAEEMLMGHNQLEFHGKPLATYEWKEGNDTPFFTFHGKNRVEFQRQQFIQMPFVDYPYLQVGWICQEVRKALSFMDALQILHIVNNYEQVGWDICGAKELEGKIIAAIINSFHPNQFEQLSEDYRKFILNDGWKWFGFGAIAEIVPESILSYGLKPYCQ